MSFGGFDSGTGQGARERGAGNGMAPLAAINMTPLIDVMLVLLVIFILTSPLLSRQIGLSLPRAEVAAAASAPAAADTPVPPTIRLTVSADGSVRWNDAPVAASALEGRLHDAAQRQPQPQIALGADEHTSYARIVTLMAAAQNAGFSRLGFLVASPATASPVPLAPQAVAPVPAKPSSAAQN